MNIERFKEGVDKIKAGWPVDRIIELTDDKIVLKCENNCYIIYKFLKPTGTQLDSFMANKVMIQFTDDLDKKYYNNITADIVGRREPTDERIKEVIKEFSMRVQVGSVLL